MVKAPIHGVMVENMRVNIIWIKNMVMESTTGLMGGDTKDTGVMESSMVRENIFYRMV